VEEISEPVRKRQKVDQDETEEKVQSLQKYVIRYVYDCVLILHRKLLEADSKVLQLESEGKARLQMLIELQKCVVVL
jgi:hypothetical protein